MASSIVPEKTSRRVGRIKGFFRAAVGVNTSAAAVRDLFAENVKMVSTVSKKLTFSPQPCVQRSAHLDAATFSRKRRFRSFVGLLRKPFFNPIFLLSLKMCVILMVNLNRDFEWEISRGRSEGPPKNEKSII
jgi:hypothetical protein